MLLQKLYKEGKIFPPKWVPDNTHYLTIMGSEAYGVAKDNSDIDVYGFCIPPKNIVFPHLVGHVDGFGHDPERFWEWQQHHINHGKSQYDFNVFNIVKYFNLLMANNPNVIDSIFTPVNCVIHSTAIANHVRDNRKLFLHKGSFHKFKGYAFSQLHKINNKNRSENPKRQADIEKFGFDVKFAYHTVRLLCEAEQIMVHHDLDIQRDREMLKAIRRGDWSIDYFKTWFAEKEKSMETIYATSTLRHSPDEKAIRAILLECLEMHYGSLDGAVKVTKDAGDLVRDIEYLLERYK